MTSPATANPRQNVTFASNGRQAHGYLATPPAGGRNPAVIVIQEWWGLVDHIAQVCDRFAEQGFVALAPDLYGGRTTHDADEAGQMMQQLPEAQAVADLSGAVDFLRGYEGTRGERIGLVGFCMGGGFVLRLAAQAGEAINAAVPFYGVVDPDDVDFSGLRADVQGHFGEQDDFMPPEKARAIEERIRAQAPGVEVEFFYYPAGHAFFNDTNALGTYNEELRDLAWERTLAFLRAHAG